MCAAHCLHDHFHRIEQAVAAYQRTALEEQAALRQKVLTLGRQLESLLELRLTKEDRRRIWKEQVRRMTYVITQPCISVKDGSCVDVCPVDCIHPAAGEVGYDEHDQLYINPDECIDCGACEPACPVTAIFEESAVPAQWREYLKINADYFKE
jgi:NAD-dependent dihydropyrimidine dehydrogenase PreA subunit